MAQRWNKREVLGGSREYKGEKRRLEAAASVLAGKGISSQAGYRDSERVVGARYQCI